MRKITVFIPITIPGKYSANVTPSILGIYNTNHDYGCLIQKLQEVSKLIHAVHILDLTHGLTLPQFIPHSQSIVDPPVHYTIGQEISKRAKKIIPKKEREQKS